MLGLACAISSCLWQEADAVVAMADSIDQNHHVIYDDTVALRKTIHTLNNPLGRPSNAVHWAKPSTIWGATWRMTIAKWHVLRSATWQPTG